MKKLIYCIVCSAVVSHLSGQAERCERIYVQTDKQLYLAGEPVLIKIITTDAGPVPLAFSKVAYVELVADTVARLQIKVELASGTGAGQMMLPADFPTGYYRLIAYTRFMRNEGAGVFFEKKIAVLNTFQPDFYPEDAETGPHFQPESTSSRIADGGVADGVVADGVADGGVRLSLQPDRAIYAKRSNGELIIDGLPENIHTLSVAVAGKDFIPVSENGASLFRQHTTGKPGGNKPAGLQGVEFLPEYEGHVITGKIVDNQTGKAAVADENSVFGLSFPGDGIRYFTGHRTGTCDVRFITSGISGMNEAATVIYSVDERYRIDIQSPFVTRYEPEPAPVLRIDTAYYERLLTRSVALQVFRYFSDVDRPENQDVSKPLFKIKPSMSYLLDEYTRFTTMREVFIEFITGARFRRNAGRQEMSVLVRRGEFYDYGSMPLVLLDGVPVSGHDAIYSYDPLTVERINIYYGPYLSGGQIFDGIVELTTYRGQHADFIPDRSTQIITYEGPQLPSHWHTPDYSDDTVRRSRIPDSRHTLLWNPEVETDGKTSIRLPFSTSDLAGEFQATVEGITRDGKFIFATAIFKVE